MWSYYKAEKLVYCAVDLEQTLFAKKRLFLVLAKVNFSA
ncbi:hypothetical protein PALB_11640 [Pseudoalteromonas luteoviolacea B = ATCC 29581]|nr:hypothetical protein PALB_11640 [Pseudoalteromonas luteoviolacea B = ATCC 29581]